MKKYVSYDKLSFFLSKLKTTFSNINHTHTTVDIENLQDTLYTMQTDTDVLSETVTNLVEKTKYNIVPITQDEYDALTVVDENTLYVIEV